MKFFRRVFRLLCLVVMLVILSIAGYNIAMRYIYPLEMTDYVEKYSEEFGVDQSLVYAIIKCESGFEPGAKSSAGAVGLMQLTEETFNDVRKMVGDGEEYTFSEDATDPEINVKYGTRYLKFLLEFFDGDKVAAIAAYNAGMGNVQEWMDGKPTLNVEDIEFEETENYVKKVLTAEQKYLSLYD